MYKDVYSEKTYYYRLSDTDFEGNITFEDVISITLSEFSGQVQLLPVTPNPFNPSTKIQYVISNDKSVQLDVVNLNGQTIRKLIDNERHQAGSYFVHWNGLDQAGIPASSSTYFLWLRAGNLYKVQKIMLVR